MEKMECDYGQGGLTQGVFRGFPGVVEMERRCKTKIFIPKSNLRDGVRSSDIWRKLGAELRRSTAIWGGLDI